jgi:Histidine kinase
MYKINWIYKLSHFLQTQAFCLAISAIFLAFQPNHSYEHPLVFSICIGTFSWLIIDFGRHLYPSAAETGWPAGVHGILLPVGGNIMGYVLGTLAGDRWFGLSSWGLQGRAYLPTTLLMTLVGSAAISYYFYTRSKNAYLETKISEVRGQASQAKLQLLQSQLDPHMLFNTLANLKVLINSDAGKASQMLDHLVDYLRSTLNASRTTEHSLAAEFDRLKDYLELMTIRMGTRLKYRLELDTELTNVLIPAMLLQSLVENSIIHGLEPKVAGGTIEVRARRLQHGVVIEIADDGIGFETANVTNGFGISQVRERLATQYGNAANMTVRSSAEGTRTILNLPL